MQDEETGSWWQQVTGISIQGPLKGHHLEPVYWEEVQYVIWKKEYPLGLVLQRDAKFKEDYAPADWEKKMASQKTVTPVNPRDQWEPRHLVAGIKIRNRAKAYSMQILKEHNPIQDIVGGVPLLLLTDREGRTVRCFKRTLGQQDLDLYRKTKEESMILIDSQTGSAWDFTGTALDGPLRGKKLERIQVLLDYWFDWKFYNPETGIFNLDPLVNR